MTDNAEQLTEAVNTAKEAVRDLEEPLKTEAFKILLDKLISGTTKTTRGWQQSNANRVSPKPRRSARTSKPAASVPTESSLKLNVDDLRKLKIYCERFDLSAAGTEQIAFILANFCREHTNLQRVTATDVAYLYRQLVSQKVKVTAVNSATDWARAMNWLSVPSRKKEWLEKSDDGYVVSNSGLLRFHDLESQFQQGK